MTTDGCKKVSRQRTCPSKLDNLNEGCGVAAGGNTISRSMVDCPVYLCKLTAKAWCKKINSALTCLDQIEFGERAASEIIYLY